MAINKVAIDGTPLIDLSTDTVASADDIALGKVGHLNTGEVVTGTHQGGSEPFELLKYMRNGSVMAYADFSALEGNELYFEFNPNHNQIGNFFSNSNFNGKILHCKFTAIGNVSGSFSPRNVKKIIVDLGQATATALRFNMNGAGTLAESTVEEIQIIGSISNVKWESYDFRRLPNLKKIDAVFDFSLTTAGTRLDVFYQYVSNIEYLRFVPNTIHMSFNGNELSGLDDISLVSLINGLSETIFDGKGSILSLSTSHKNKCNSIIGTVSTVADNNTSYKFFTVDESGTVSLTQFITDSAYKGWTLQ